MVQQFILFFALLLTGYLCKRQGVIDEGMDRGLNKFIITISFPCLILDRMVHLNISDKAFEWFLITVGICFCLFGIYAVYAFFYTKFRKLDIDIRPIAEFSIISPNNGFMGFPIAVAFLGNLGLLYMVACNLALNLMFFTYGIFLMNRGRESGKKSIGKLIIDFIKLIANPKILAAIIGLLLCYNQVTLPELIGEYVGMIGAVASPMALVFIGSTLYGSSIKKVIKDKNILSLSINKLIVIPILTLAIVYFLPLPNIIKAVLVISNALPVATTVPIFSELYERDKNLAGEILFLSTLLSVITIPLFIILLENILI